MGNLRMTMGVIVGNRGFFPEVLAKAGREDIIAALARAGMDAVVLSPEESKYGAVETHEEAKRCAELFRANAAKIDGVIVTLPNFGDERAVAETLRLANLGAPVLVQASPDASGKMTQQQRRDSFCGKISVCNNLRQFGIPFSLTAEHTEALDSDLFLADLKRFAAVCRVVKGMKNLRIGCIGARPAAFNTVRYSERILEAHGISVETVDLSEIFGRIDRLAADDPAVTAKVAELHSYVRTAVPEKAIIRMAKLAHVIADWMRRVDVSVSAIQCWTSMQENLGVMPCTVMSMMSNGLMSSACEADIGGTLSMHALALAGESPSALLDWNNNYGANPDKAVCFHCSNLPKSFFVEAHMRHGEIFAATVGEDNAQGTMAGLIKASPMTFARVSTDDLRGKIRGYVGEGRFTADALETFGGAGVVEISGLQALMRFICENGFEHHVAANMSNVADAVYEAGSKYLDWEMSLHSGA
jgi:L-fucose isomerase-like protein